MSKRGNAQNAAKCKAYRDRGQREKNIARKERRRLLGFRTLSPEFRAALLAKRV